MLSTLYLFLQKLSRCVYNVCISVCIYIYLRMVKTMGKMNIIKENEKLKRNLHEKRF